MLRPLSQQVLVEMIIPAAMAGVLHLPDKAKHSRHARVLACGPKVLDVCAGMQVLLPEYGGVEIKMDGRNCRLHKQAEILAVLE